MSRLIDLVRRTLPVGGTLSEDSWQRRHRGIIVLLWLHAIGVMVFGLLTGAGLVHSVAEGGALIFFALLADYRRAGRTFRAGVASFGLVTASAMLVHLSGGYIELHFHYFVVVAVVTLYQQWTPFLLAIGYVVTQHGLGGMFAPTSVYNHPAAWENPWEWAVIHATLLAAASVAAVLNWRMNEAAGARAHLLLSSAGEGICGLDRDGSITFVNPAVSQMTGSDPGDLVGQPYWAVLREIVPEGSLQETEQSEEPSDDWRALPIQETLRDGVDGQGGEGWLLTKSWSRVPIEYLATPIRERGQLTGAVVTLKDISERKQSEVALRASNQRLSDTLDELQQAQQHVIRQERLRALGQMASGIAHDFNNALSPVVGFTELLLARPHDLNDTAKVRDYLQLMNTAAKDAGSVVSRLREFYRYREAKDPVVLVELNQLVAEVMSLTQPKWKDQAQARGAMISLKTALQDLPPIPSNPAELRAVLTNLIFNAVDAMPDGGIITIRTRLDGEQAVLEVQDTGTGMSEEVRQRCLEPFFTTKGERGSGLGLAMAYGIIERHDGTLDIRSKPGKGTTIVISLPLHQRSLPTEDDPVKTILATRPLRVLLVDDEPLVRQVVSELLMADGHTVDVAANGREGLERFRPDEFDLVITDRAMPELGGDQLAAAVKQHTPAMPVIMLTGFGEMMQTGQEHPDGVDLVLNKPVTLTSLRQALAATAAKSLAAAL